MNLLEYAFSAITGRDTADSGVTRVPLERPVQDSEARARNTRVEEAFDLAARQFQLDPGLLRSMADRGAGGRGEWLNDGDIDAVGIMRLPPQTARRLKVNPLDPVQSIYGAAAELRAQLDRFGGNYEQALAAYGAGGRQGSSPVPATAPAAPQDTQAEQQVTSSARAWHGGGGGRGAVSGMRLDTDKGRRELAVEQEMDRLAAINPGSREKLRALAEFNVSPPAVAPKPVDRKAQYAGRGYGDADASANARFDARLEQRLNARTRTAAPDAVTGERIVLGYNPNTERERVVAEEREMRALQADARMRAAAQDMPAVARGLAKGGGELIALGQGAAGLVGQLTGDEALREWGLAGYRDTMRTVDNIGMAPGFTGIRSADDAAQWAMENSGYLAVQAASAVLASGMGGVIANTVGKRALGEVIGSTLFDASQTFGSVYVDAVEQARRTGQPVDLERAMAGAATSLAINALAGRIGLDAPSADAFKARAYAQVARSVGAQTLQQGAIQGAQRVAEDWGAKGDPFGEGQSAGFIDEAAVGVLSGVLSGARGARRAAGSPATPHAMAARAEEPGGRPAHVPAGNGVPRVEDQPARPQVPADWPGPPAAVDPRHGQANGQAVEPLSAVRQQRAQDALARTHAYPDADAPAQAIADAPAPVAVPSRGQAPVAPAASQAAPGDAAGVDGPGGAGRMEPSSSAHQVHALDSGTLLVQGDSSHIRTQLLQAGVAEADIQPAGAGELLVAQRSAAHAREALALQPGPGGHGASAAQTVPVASAPRMRRLDKGSLAVEGAGPSERARLQAAGVPEGDLKDMPGGQLLVAPGSAARAQRVLAADAADAAAPATARAQARGQARPPSPAQPAVVPPPSAMDGAQTGVIDGGVTQAVVSTLPSKATVDDMMEKRRSEWPKTGPDGQPWKPNAYTVAFEMQLDLDDFGHHRKVHYQRANAALKKALDASPEFARMMEAMIPGVGHTVSARGTPKPPPGWIWEHASTSTADGRKGVMRLVPKEQHTPGSPFWRVLHPDPGASGGYSEWAIPAGAPPNRKKKKKSDDKEPGESGSARET